jgi:solute carrier family 25 protein 39/40
MSTTTATASTTTSTERLLSACGGALVTSLMVTPMDVVKMRMQTQHVYHATASSLSKAICCMTFNNCTQSIKHGLQYNRSISTCAVHPTATNSTLFKGTFVSII